MSDSADDAKDQLSNDVSSQSSPTAAKRLKENDSGDSIDESSLCESKCRQFVDVTGVDCAVAHMLLQECDWNLEKAVELFLECSENEKINSKNGLAAFDVVEHSSSSVVVKATSAAAAQLQFRLLSWNIDGLDEKNRSTRTQAVATIIKKELPDVIFLQEVIPETMVILYSLLFEHYEVLNFCQTTAVGHYFVVILLLKNTLKYRSNRIVKFPGSVMNRNLLVVEALLSNTVPVTLMTSHLESTSAYGEERKRQLRICFDEMLKIAAAADHSTAAITVFGGDLNLRDTELEAIGGLPAGIVDVWQACGSLKTNQYTWDRLNNDNCGSSAASGGFLPRYRYDRIYFRNSTSLAQQQPTVRPPSTTFLPFEPISLELVGCRRIKSCQCFPSDHFGLLTCFRQHILKFVK